MFDGGIGMVKDAETAHAQTEQTLLKLWSVVLETPQITRESDFFALGGDSLAMLNLQFQLEKVLGVDIPPGVLYENPTFGAFAGVVHAAKAGKCPA
jgi:acyl carrier protein